MEYDPQALEQRLQAKETKYIVVYPDAGIDVVSFTDELRSLLNAYHTRGQGWTIGSNIELDGIPLVEASSEGLADDRTGYSIRSFGFSHPGI